MFNIGFQSYKTAVLPIYTPTTEPSILTDGNTYLWYDFANTASITKDSANSVSRWNNRILNSLDLIQASGASQPKYTPNGVLFDGSNDFMKAPNFTYFSQPYCFYLVYKVLSWSMWGFIFHTAYGQPSNYMSNSPQMYPEGGGSSNSACARNVPLTDFFIERIFLSPASYKHQINSDTASTVAIGTGQFMPSFMLAVNQSLTDRFANIQVKEVIFRRIMDTTPDETAIYNYLKTKHNL